MMTFFAPIKDSTVRSMRSSRACTSTWRQYIVRRALFLDEPAVESEIQCWTRYRKADLDLLEAGLY